MNVNANGSMQQMQMQMRKMDGSGSGQGNGGMKDIMQNLSSDDRATIKEELSAMTQEERSAMISQMKEVDSVNMSAEEFSQTLLDMLNQVSSNETTSTAFGFSTYA